MKLKHHITGEYLVQTGHAVSSSNGIGTLSTKRTLGTKLSFESIDVLNFVFAEKRAFLYRKNGENGFEKLA